MGPVQGRAKNYSNYASECKGLWWKKKTQISVQDWSSQSWSLLDLKQHALTLYVSGPFHLECRNILFKHQGHLMLIPLNKNGFMYQWGTILSLEPSCGKNVFVSFHDGFISRTHSKVIWNWFFFCVAGGVICCVLYSVGMIFYKLVGSIYLSSDSSTVKISYLDFWGKRVDVCCPLSDIVPFSDTNERTMDVYVNLRRYSTPQKLHFTLRFGSVLDTKLFTDVFGNTN